MPHIRLNGDRFLLSSDLGTSSSGYFVDLASDFNEFRENAKFNDLKIWCKDGSVRAHKIMVASKSRLLSTFFRDIPSSSDIFCPDFSIERMVQLLDLLYSGQVVIAQEPDLREIFAIIDCLDFRVVLSDSSTPTQPDAEAQEGEVEVVPPEATPADVDFSDESLDTHDEILSQYEEEKTSAKQTEEKKEEDSTKPDTPKTKQTLKCSDCHKIFGMQIALNKHRQRVHQAAVSASPSFPVDASNLEKLFGQSSVSKKAPSNTDSGRLPRMGSKPEKTTSSKDFCHISLVL